MTKKLSADPMLQSLTLAAISGRAEHYAKAHAAHAERIDHEEVLEIKAGDLLAMLKFTADREAYVEALRERIGSRRRRDATELARAILDNVLSAEAMMLRVEHEFEDVDGLDPILTDVRTFATRLARQVQEYLTGSVG